MRLSHSLNHHKIRPSILLIGSLVMCILLVHIGLDRIPQPSSYHNFADTRQLSTIPNWANVLSNLPFILIGGWFMYQIFTRSYAELLANQSGFEDALWMFFGFCIMGIGLGSSYYHLHPTTERLFWDRLPISLTFMTLFTAVISERISERLGRMVFMPLLMLSVSSVFWWSYSEYLGDGDLRLYGVTQFYPLLALPIIIWRCAPRYTHGVMLMHAMGWYLFAKIVEINDFLIYSWTGQLVSGHTLKHMFAGVALILITHMVLQRVPVTRIRA